MKITRKIGEQISPSMIGLFFEDINCAADGGLYAELIENRSFEAREAHGTAGNFYTVEDCGYAWSAVSNSSAMPAMRYVCGTPLSEANPHYLRFTATEAGQGFANQAYDGIFMKAGDVINIEFYARTVDYHGCFDVSLVVDGDSDIATSSHIVPKYAIPFKPFSDVTVPFDPGPAEQTAFDAIHAMDKSCMVPASSWVKYETTITANKNIEGARFVITLDAPGVVDFDFISAIPADAVAGVFRKDLFEALRDINPGFLRFPGGCIVEGISLENRYRWKRTVGRTIDRKVIPSLWSFCWDNSLDSLDGTVSESHYSQSYGIGFYEYLLLCELLGAKAVPVLSIGVACQFRSTELTDIDSEEFQEYIQDALDLIEFANGDTDTKWGSLRASMGHPESFELEMIAIGNEQWETETLQLFERNNRFEKAIHDVYPGFKLLGTAGPAVDMNMCGLAWDYYRDGLSRNPDFCYAVDEHYYKDPQWMYDNIEMYDNYPRDIAVFAGEYAAHTATKSNNMEAALAEAAFMTGFEKNAGVIKLASYAPLFYRIGHGQWIPDMIWFDATSVIKTPSYYVQKLFSNNLGDHTLIMDEDTIALRKQGIYVSISECNDGELIIKAVNTTDAEFTCPLTEVSEAPIIGEANITVLYSEAADPVDMPQECSVENCECPVNGEIKLRAQSLSVIRIK